MNYKLLRLPYIVASLCQLDMTRLGVIVPEKWRNKIVSLNLAGFVFVVSMSVQDRFSSFISPWASKGKPRPPITAVKLPVFLKSPRGETEEREEYFPMYYMKKQTNLLLLTSKCIQIMWEKKTNNFPTSALTAYAIQGTLRYDLVNNDTFLMVWCILLA